MSNELLPCPFCGGEKIGKITVNPSLEPRHRRFKVYCIECQVRTQDHRTRKEAKEAWNQRSQQSAPAGYLMVPVEPTPEMVAAAHNKLKAEGLTVSDWFTTTAYRAAVAAAPKAEPQPSDDARDALVEALEVLAKLGNGEHYGNSDGNVIAQRALAAYRAAMGRKGE